MYCTLCIVCCDHESNVHKLQPRVRGAGRVAEIVSACWEYFHYDLNYKCVFGEIPQKKTSKSKSIPFCAGNCRHNCWLLSLGDFLITQGARSDTFFDPNNMGTWMFKEIEQSSMTPGVTISNYVKDLRPSSTNCTYKDKAGEVNLPVSATGGAFSGNSQYSPSSGTS